MESKWKSVTKTTGNSQNTWKLSNMLINNYGSKKKSKEIKKCIDLNTNENTTYQFVGYSKSSTEKNL